MAVYYIRYIPCVQNPWCTPGSERICQLAMNNIDLYQCQSRKKISWFVWNAAWVLLALSLDFRNIFQAWVRNGMIRLHGSRLVLVRFDELVRSWFHHGTAPNGTFSFANWINQLITCSYGSSVWLLVFRNQKLRWRSNLKQRSRRHRSSSSIFYRFLSYF